MVVKKVVRKKKKKVKRKRSAESGASAKPDYPGLPTEKKAAVTDLLKYTLLLYGREKIGKTIFLSSFPEALFLTTEPGTKGLRIFEYNAEDGGCKSWDYIRAAVEMLENSDRYQTVVIDTVDRAYDMCLDWVCENLGIPYPGRDDSGKEDFGKSWKAVKSEFTNLVYRILQTGRGLCFTSHSKEQEIKSRSGDKYTRIFPSMSGQARGVVEALVDLFFYCEYMRSSKRKSARVIITQGDEVVWAGAREVGFDLPRFIPMTKEGGFDILQAAFNGEDVGLDPQTLLPVRSASEAVKKFFQHAADEPPAAKPKAKAKKRKVRKVRA